MRWTKRRDRANRISFIPYQTADFDQLPADITRGLAKSTVVFIGKNAKKYREARAVFEILRLLPGFYGFTGRILSNRFFGFLFGPAYRLFARNRGLISKIFGAREPDLKKKVN